MNLSDWKQNRFSVQPVTPGVFQVLHVLKGKHIELSQVAHSDHEH